MSEAPERVWFKTQCYWSGPEGVKTENVVVLGEEPGFDPYIRLDLYESERALNAELVAALKQAEAYVDDEEVVNCSGATDDIRMTIHAALAKAEAREKGEGGDG